MNGTVGVEECLGGMLVANGTECLPFGAAPCSNDEVGGSTGDPDTPATPVEETMAPSLSAATSVAAGDNNNQQLTSIRIGGARRPTALLLFIVLFLFAPFSTVAELADSCATQEKEEEEQQWTFHIQQQSSIAVTFSNASRSSSSAACNVPTKQQQQEHFPWQDAAYATYGDNTTLIPLTRAYVPGGWKDAVDAVLDNPKVGGLCFEPVLAAALEETPGIHNVLPWAIQTVLGKNKTMFLLLHTGGDLDPWPDADQPRILASLKRWLTPAEIQSDSLILVYQVYDIFDPLEPGTNTSARWFGETESVRSALDIAKAHPDYTGNLPKVIRKRDAMRYVVDGDNRGVNGQDVHLWEISDRANVNQQWEEVYHGNEYYSYIKKDTMFALSGNTRTASTFLWEYSHENQTQQWRKTITEDGFYRLENYDGGALDGGDGESNGQHLLLRNSDVDNRNQHWSLEETGRLQISTTGATDVPVAPNPSVIPTLRSAV